MKTSRQTYTPSTLLASVTAGCDIVQPKLRGRWTRTEISRGLARVYSDRQETLTSFDVPEGVVCSLIGDYFFKTNSITFWDCWAIGEDEEIRPIWTSIEDYSYRERFAFLRQNFARLAGPFDLVKNYPIHMARDLWLENDPNWCGLVFRSSKDKVDAPVRFIARYPEVPRALE